jgi:hypothetical protein
MAAFHTTPHGAGPATGDVGPAVINVRRPRATLGEAPIPAELVLAKADETLPPTALRLPNLAAIPAPPSTLNKIFSILHWCFIGLGSLIALWLIFGGRGGPKPTGEDIPAAPARAQVDSTPAWNPPALDTAGDSDAPKWTPPPASVAPTTPAEAPPSMEIAPPAAAPAGSAPVTSESDAPSYDAWPQGDAKLPEAPAADAPQPEAAAPEATPEPELPAAPAWQEASAPPAAATAGPVARTAARETPAASPAPGGEAHPLDLTVPVPQ